MKRKEKVVDSFLREPLTNLCFARFEIKNFEISLFYYIEPIKISTTLFFYCHAENVSK